MVGIEANMKLLKFKIEIKGPLSDLNLRGNFSVPVLHPSPHTVWQTIFPVFEQESNSLLNFLFSLFGNPFELCRNIDLEFCITLMKNPCCFPFSQIPSCSIPLSLIKIILPCCYPLVQFPSYWEPSDQVNTPYPCSKPSSKNLLVQLANIYIDESNIYKISN